VLPAVQAHRTEEIEDAAFLQENHVHTNPSSFKQFSNLREALENRLSNKGQSDTSKCLSACLFCASMLLSERRCRDRTLWLVAYLADSPRRAYQRNKGYYPGTSGWRHWFFPFWSGSRSWREVYQVIDQTPFANAHHCRPLLVIVQVFQVASGRKEASTSPPGDASFKPSIGSRLATRNPPIVRSQPTNRA
jgi:hypothetical protein